MVHSLQVEDFSKEEDRIPLGENCRETITKKCVQNPHTRPAKEQLFFHYMIMRKAFSKQLLSGKECYKTRLFYATTLDQYASSSSSNFNSQLAEYRHRINN